MSTPNTTASLVSILVPTYNERGNLPTLIARLHHSLAPQPYELVIIDDASPDGTATLAHAQAATHPELRIIERPGKRGLSSAILDGARATHGDLCVAMDADLQHPPERVPALLAAFNAEVDLVVASRYVPGGGIAQWSRRRRLVSQSATFLARLLLPRARPVHDPLSGFFAIRRSILLNAAYDPVGYKILLEILVRGPYRAVREIPYIFQPRHHGQSKLRQQEYGAFLRHLRRLRR